MGQGLSQHGRPCSINAEAAKSKLLVAPRLQHFHFWCLQSDRTQRGFSSRKDALRCSVLFRVEVKML